MKEEIKKALEKATPGQWNKEGVEVWRRGTGYDTSEERHIWICDVFNENDAHLIANSPGWLRYMLSENEEKDKRIEQLEQVLGEIKSLILITQEIDESPSLRHNAANMALYKINQALGKEE